MRSSTMKNCSNLYYLSTIACKLSECLSEEELAVLSADLVALGDMLANILSHQALLIEEEPWNNYFTPSYVMILDNKKTNHLLMVG